MKNEEDRVQTAQIVEVRARSISHNVRCTECGSQSIEDSQADVAVLLRKLIRDKIRAGKSEKEIYKKLEEDFGETVLYAPRFDLQTAAFWLSPASREKSSNILAGRIPPMLVLVAGAFMGFSAYERRKQRTNVYMMSLDLVRKVPLTVKERETMVDLLTPPPPPRRNRWQMFGLGR